jgi:hypothetical protein
VFLWLPLLAVDDELAEVVPVATEVLVTVPVFPGSVVAPVPVQIVIVALAVTTAPSYKLQVKTAPLTGVASPPGLFVNGSVPFLGMVAASKNWLLVPGPGDSVKLYGLAVQFGLAPSDEEHSDETRWSYPRSAKKKMSPGSVVGHVLKNLSRE